MNQRNDIQNDRKDVTFRYLAIPFDGAEIGGIALWYTSKQKAILAFKKFHDYLDASGEIQRYLDINLERDSNCTYKLTIIIVCDEDVHSVVIEGIDDEYIKKLQSSLNNFQYYLITAGYSDAFGNSELLPIREFNFFKQCIKIDGELVQGKKKKQWPVELFRSENSMITKFT